MELWTDVHRPVLTEPLHGRRLSAMITASIHSRWTSVSTRRGRGWVSVRIRVRRLERFADLAPGMAEGPGDLPNAHPVPVRTTYPAVVFHL
jgi:hypothetical protein